MDATKNKSQPVRPHLTLWDSVSIIVGIVIGAGIYETAPLIFGSVPGPWTAMGVWLAGGFLSLVGALCYAELASTYPRSGGDYIYLSRAFGSWMGFLFGWAQLAVILTGSIGMMAYIFADYAAAFWQLGVGATVFLASTAVIALTAANFFLIFGKRTQNFFTIAKILGLALVVIVGSFALPSSLALPEPQAAAGSAEGIPWSSLGLAMVFVLYTYGGWNDAAFVAAEHKKRKNIPRALILGTGIITFIYLLVNLAYLSGLGFERAQNADAIAADLLAPLGTLGTGFMSFLVMASALGAVNGLIYTGSRLYATLGSGHSVLGWLNTWHPRLRVPTVSLLAQAVISVGLIFLVGSVYGRASVTWAATTLGAAAPVWEGHGGFDTLLRCSAPVFWSFFLLTGISLFVLRFKDKGIARPFKVPLYPLTPLLFCATSAYMLYRSIDYAGSLTLVGLGFLLAGLPVYFYGRLRDAARAGGENVVYSQFVREKVASNE